MYCRRILLLTSPHCGSAYRLFQSGILSLLILKLIQASKSFLQLISIKILRSVKLIKIKKQKVGNFQNQTKIKYQTSNLYFKSANQQIYSKMNSYLQTLKNLQIDHSDSQIYQEASQYATYQDFLHRRSKMRYPVTQSYQPQRRIKTHIDDHLQTHAELKNKSETVYYPVNRTQIQYQDRRYVQKIPKTKKVVEYIEKKEVEIIPKEVKKTDYYAVQHLRTYYKQVVPEVRVQTIQVPKVIKNVQFVPVEKQIIYYPSYLTDMKQIKEQAKKNLEKQCVVLRQDAEYRPLNAKMNRIEVNSNALSQQLKYKIQQAQQKLQKIQKMEMNQAIRQNNEQYFHLTRPKNHSKQFKSNLSNNTNKRVSWGSIPVYQKQKYENGIYKSYLSGKNGSVSTYYEPRDSIFAEKDLYRYNLAVNSSIKSRY